MDFVTLGLGLGALGLLLIYGWIARPLYSALAPEDAPSKGRALCASLITFALALPVLALSLPPFWLCAALYAGLFVLRRPGGPLSQTLVAVNLLAAHLMGLYLFTLAVAALCVGLPPIEAYAVPALRWLCLDLDIAANCLMALVYRRFLQGDTLRLLSAHTGRLRQVRDFIWFLILFTLLDSLLCVTDLPYSLLCWFLAGSCLLMLLQLSLFLRHSYAVAAQTQAQDELLRLQAEQQAQLIRQMQLRALAHTDSLTGVYTRRFILETLRKWLSEGTPFALAYIDLDGLKAVNDRLGHSAGDEYLTCAARAVNASLRRQDVLARVGGDEFVAALPRTSIQEARSCLSNAQRALKAQGDALGVGLSYGVVSSSDASDVESLLRAADEAMYRDKRAHKRKGV